MSFANQAAPSGGRCPASTFTVGSEGCPERAVIAIIVPSLCPAPHLARPCVAGLLAVVLGVRGTISRCQEKEEEGEEVEEE